MSKRVLGTFGGSLLVAGTSIGGGMLGLPVVTGPGGFFPALVILFISWLFMTSTGLLLAELCLSLKKEVNIISIAQKTIGKPGLFLAWISYLFLFYSLTVAYLVGGGNLLGDFLSNVSASNGMGNLGHLILYAVFFISIIAIGKRFVDPLNKFFMFGLFAAWIGFVIVGISYVQYENLTRTKVSHALMALPIAFTSFGFQGTVPTLTHWMHYNTTNIRKAIICGTTLALFVYILWEFLLLGIVPQDGAHGLQEALNEGRDAIHPLQYFTQNPLVWDLGRIFAFCAISTSFLGIGIGLIDFLADGLGIDKNSFQGKTKLIMLSFLPSFLIAVFYPHIFLEALSVAGGLGCALLLGVLPLAMIFVAKYKKKLLLSADTSFLTKKSVLSCLFLFVTFEILFEIIHIIKKIY